MKMDAGHIRKKDQSQGREEDVGNQRGGGEMNSEKALQKGQGRDRKGGREN